MWPPPITHASRQDVSQLPVKHFRFRSSAHPEILHMVVPPTDAGFWRTSLQTMASAGSSAT